MEGCQYPSQARGEVADVCAQCAGGRDDVGGAVLPWLEAPRTRKSHEASRSAAPELACENVVAACSCSIKIDAGDFPGAGGHGTECYFPSIPMTSQVHPAWKIVLHSLETHDR